MSKSTESFFNSLIIICVFPHSITLCAFRRVNVESFLKIVFELCLWDFLLSCWHTFCTFWLYYQMVYLTTTRSPIPSSNNLQMVCWPKYQSVTVLSICQEASHLCTWAGSDNYIRIATWLAVFQTILILVVLKCKNVFC